MYIYTMYMHMCVYIYTERETLYEKLFPKHNLQTWHRFANPFLWNSIYRILEKSSSYDYRYVAKPKLKTRANTSQE